MVNIKEAAAVGKEMLKGGNAMKGEDILKFIGPMIDGMIKEVPLDKFEEMKKVNPKAPIVPIMEFEQIKTYEAKVFLRLLSFFGADLPAEIKKPAFKLGFGIAYKIDNNEEFRKKYTELIDYIVSTRNNVKAN